MTHKFWLDGGYDRECVEACRLHPFHEWRALKIGVIMGDEMPKGSDPDESFTFCRVCGVPRCGESDPAGCNLPRHHPEHHETADGEYWPVGGTRAKA